MIELGHKVIGRGKNIVMILHDLMGNHKNYDAILPYLNTMDFTYIFVDLRGYGLSKHIKGLFSCEEAANDIKNLISALNLKKINLVAHSMSTMIAQKVALLDKENIEQLILITPILSSGIQLPKHSQEKLLSDMRENKGNLEEIVQSASKRYNQSWKKNRIDMAYNASTLDARVGYMKMYLTTNFVDESKEVKIPIKVIVGKHDFQIFSLKTVSRLFTPVYQDLEILECQEAGHYPMLECPVYFASQVESFCNL